MEYLAVFRSRTEIYAFKAKLCKSGGAARLVNTPREISTSCGLSVQFCGRDYMLAKRIVSSEKYQSFLGFYLL